ncbi:glycosyltransferase family 4 protein [Luteolibacter yonseiensis]|uniref:Glycosyltransferase family 4 protein n=1 Tax=Luteolibacter yonseiensis TaxID=1144680 RepID=A0A934RA45_9BACT|nr:glycosyltransferase family 4 protein [Luteolibacter yonseiensis]MBK1817960.1 glycosyltransferase family 4 protein [Luteolibacter yonseiensis]
MSILFYDDSPVFGGHEVMSLLGLEAVLADSPHHVRFLASSANEKLCEKVTALTARHPQLVLEKVDWQSSKLEALRNRLQPSRVTKLAARFREINPSLVVAIQGNIEHSSLSLLAARRAGIRCASYIPVPHSNAEMGAKLGALRDFFCSHVFKLPDSFITITDEMARLLKAQGATVPIHIVYNGVDTTRFHPGDASAACDELGLPPDKTRIGVIGRIEFRQKQQHLLVEAVSADASLVRTCHLVFAGDGPDREELKTMLRQRGVDGTVLPWCDPARLYQALDALAIPSRYEGLPLVMLEALSSGTTVLGSDRDGMKDLLPADRRFEPNSTSALTAAINRFIANGKSSPPPSLVARVRETMSLTSFSRDFSKTVFSLMP